MKSFWSYQAPEPSPEPPEGVNITQDEWEQLTPGYRREITRQFTKRDAK